MFEDLILLSLWCWHHRKRTWHLMRIDGLCECLECRLEGHEAGSPFLAEGVHQGGT